MKDIFSIRVNKEDIGLKHYLEQFPESQQNQAIKNLCLYGVERLEKNFEQDEALNRIEEELKTIQAQYDDKFNQLLKKIENADIQDGQRDAQTSVPEPQQDDEDISIESIKSSFTESFQNFG